MAGKRCTSAGPGPVRDYAGRPPGRALRTERALRPLLADTGVRYARLRRLYNQSAGPDGPRRHVRPVRNPGDVRMRRVGTPETCGCAGSARVRRADAPGRQKKGTGPRSSERGPVPRVFPLMTTTRVEEVAGKLLRAACC